jgi:large subunit ribosomal protein L29
MELQKIRNLSDLELTHQEKTSAEQLFRLRFQVSMGQNDGVKKLRQLRKEIAQVKTVVRERELGLHGESKEAKSAVTPVATPVEEAKPAVAPKAKKAKPAVAKAKKTVAKPKTEEAKGARK